MATTKQQENMLLTEHFTWPPISLIDDIINMINEVLYRCTNTLDQQLSSIDPSVLGFADRAAQENRTVEQDEEGRDLYPEAKLEIEEGVLKLETLVENAVDKNFDKLEIWTLRNVLCLPKEDEEIGRWMRLGHYENISTPPKDNTINPEALHALRRRLQETQKLHYALLAEKARNEAQIQKLRSLLQPSPQPKHEPRASTSPAKPTSTNGAGDVPFAFLTHIPGAQALGIQSLPVNASNGTASSDSRTPLTTHTQFTTSQLPYLRQLLANLQPHLATTALPMRNEGAKEELAKERQVYIESQSKRILERRGVDTMDGVEGAVEGQRVRAEEVRGLEGIVQRMGKERRTENDGDAMDTS